MWTVAKIFTYVGGIVVTIYGTGAGERVKKASFGISYYHYDRRGQLLAETDGQGATLKEYVYLDDLPLALLDPPAQDPASQVIDNTTSGAFTVAGSWHRVSYAQAIGGNYRRRAGGTQDNIETRYRDHLPRSL